MKLKKLYCFKNKNEAVLTIELSLLMPGIMAVIIFIIYVSFYLHDKCVFERACYNSAVRNRYLKNEELLCEKICDNIDDILQQDLFSVWEYTAYCEIKNEKINIYIKGEIKLSDSLLFDYIDSALFNINETVSVYKTFEPDYLRRNHYDH